MCNAIAPVAENVQALAVPENPFRDYILRFQLYSSGSVCTCIRDFDSGSNATKFAQDFQATTAATFAMCPTPQNTPEEAAAIMAALPPMMQTFCSSLGLMTGIAIRPLWTVRTDLIQQVV